MNILIEIYKLIFKVLLMFFVITVIINMVLGR